jgi:hypothetical protein
MPIAIGAVNEVLAMAVEEGVTGTAVFHIYASLCVQERKMSSLFLTRFGRSCQQQLFNDKW